MGELAWNGRVVLTGLGNSQLAYSALEKPSGFLMPATPWSVIVGHSCNHGAVPGVGLSEKWVSRAVLIALWASLTWAGVWSITLRPLNVILPDGLVAVLIQSQ